MIFKIASKTDSCMQQETMMYIKMSFQNAKGKTVNKAQERRNSRNRGIELRHCLLVQNRLWLPTPFPDRKQIFFRRTENIEHTHWASFTLHHILPVLQHQDITVDVPCSVSWHLCLLIEMAMFLTSQFAQAIQVTSLQKNSHQIPREDTFHSFTSLVLILFTCVSVCLCVGNGGIKNHVWFILSVLNLPLILDYQMWS